VNTILLIYMSTIRMIMRLSKFPDGEILSGEIPNRKLRLVQAWVELHSEELMANWKLVTNGELPFKADPLR